MGRGFRPFAGDAWELLVHARQPFRWGLLWETWAAPLGLFALAALVGTITRPPRGWAALAWAALLLPSLLFFHWWGLPEKGAYFLATAPFYAVLAGGAFTAFGGSTIARPALACGALALFVGGQLAWAESERRAWDLIDVDDVVRRADWVAGVLGHRGALVSVEPMLPPVQQTRPSVREFNILPTFWDRVTKGATPESFADEVVEKALLVLNDRQPVALDLGYRKLLESYPMYRPYFDLLEQRLAAAGTARELAHPDWPLLLVHPSP